MQQKINLYTIFLWLLVLFTITIHFCFLIPATDSGIFLYGSMLISRGSMPYVALFDNKPPLIYFIGLIGYIIRSNPFLVIRIFELAIFLLNLYLINAISKILGLKAVYYMLSFCVLYLIFWDRGFLTETFNVPLVLAGVYVFMKRYKYTEYLLAAFLLLSFLLKPNAIGIMSSICIIDVLFDYRNTKKAKKILHYTIALLIYSTVTILLFASLGILEQCYFQAFQYNIQHVQRTTLAEVLRHYLFGDALHLIILILFTLFNIVLINLLYRYYQKYKRSGLSLVDIFLCFAILSYGVEFICSYSYGKTYPHYFLLLIVPVSFLLGSYFDKNKVVASSIVLLGFVAIGWNIKRYIAYRDIEVLNVRLIEFVKNNTTTTDKIYVVGQDDTYLYTSAGRLSNTRYLMPLSELTDYSNIYKAELEKDFRESPPKYIIINKQDVKELVGCDYYKQVITQSIHGRHTILEDEFHVVYK